jgi:hypothetical protein
MSTVSPRSELRAARRPRLRRSCPGRLHRSSRQPDSGTRSGSPQSARRRTGGSWPSKLSFLGCWRRLEASRSLVNVRDPTSAESSEHKTPSVICWASERLSVLRWWHPHEAHVPATRVLRARGGVPPHGTRTVDRFSVQLPHPILFYLRQRRRNHVLESINNLGLGLPSIDGCGGLRLA